MLTERVSILRDMLSPDNLTKHVVHYWDNYRRQILPKLDECLEVRNYIFATDTSTTSLREVPDEYAWKNNTHLPKLAEVRDNLLAIYKATWFPNDFWMKWEAYSLDEDTQEKKDTIEAYMRNKLRLFDFEGTIDKVAADYIDTGNCFAVASYRDDRVFGSDRELIKDSYRGPVAIRVSPYDIAFDITANNFSDSIKVIRTLKTVGEMVSIAESIREEDPEKANKIMECINLRTGTKSYKVDDFQKAEAYSVDGFGNYKEYMDSGCVELLTLYGTVYDEETGELKRDHKITVMDRKSVIEEGPWDSRLRDGGIYHCGYRKRPDSLWAMGPLDNLVGMQYRIDHLQGAIDDNVDLNLHPTKIITGDPEETELGPDKEIRLGEGDSIDFKSPELSHMQLNNEINYLLQLMEEFVGSPKQSRGFRTPGEKTLGEVSLLESNSNRLFLDKAMQFEKELIEPLLNGMLDEGVRNFDGTEAVNIFDSSLGMFVTISITEKDIEANGLLAPIGARHFGQRNQQLQNLLQIYNSPLGQKIDPHISGENLASLIRDQLQLERFGLVSNYIGVHESGEAARVTMQVQKELSDEAAVDTEGDIEERIDEDL